METFEEYVNTIEKPENRAKFQEILDWVDENYPQLDKRIAWNSPMLTHHGTFIISLTAYKQHLSVSPEGAGISHFADQIKERGWEAGTMQVKFPWSKEFDFDLLRSFIDFNLEDKKDCQTFWRK